MKTKFNWITALRQAIRKEPTVRKCERLQYRASEWAECACGQLCKKLPKDNQGLPLDVKLQHYGVRFCTMVWHGRWHDALRIFYRIEKRTSILLKKQ